MDSSMFERKLDSLRKGEYVNDPALYEYCRSALFESKRFMSALQECAAQQAQRNTILRRMNEDLAETVKRLMIENRDLKERLTAAEKQVTALTSDDWAEEIRTAKED